MKRIPLITFAVTSILIGMLLASVIYFIGVDKGINFIIAEKPAAENQSMQQAMGLQNAFRIVAKNAVPAVVNISTEYLVKGYSGSPFGQGDPFRDFFGDDFFKFFFNEPRREQKRENPLGSGVIISEDGLLLTNVHVIRNASKITVTLADERKFTAKVIGKDSKTDLALIKIKSSKPLPYIPLGDSDELEVGDWAIAIGNPFGLNQTFTVGVISAKGRSDIGLNAYENFIQTDASINPGNSGGPLLNINGEVIGINTAITTPSGGSVGIGFAIPINMAKSILPQLKEKGKVIRGWLGVHIDELTEEKAKPLGLEPKSGILVVEVLSDTPAEKFGIKTGDIIMFFDEKRVKTVRELRQIVAETKVGKTVSLVVLRNKKKITLKAKIGEMPSDEDIASAEGAETGTEEWLGMTVTTATPSLKQQFRINNKEKGVIVVKIKPSSPASAEGVVVGDLIKKIDYTEIGSLSDFSSFIKKNKNKDSFLLLINRKNNLIFLGISRD